MSLLIVESDPPSYIFQAGEGIVSEYIESVIEVTVSANLCKRVISTAMVDLSCARIHTAETRLYT